MTQTLNATDLMDTTEQDYIKQAIDFEQETGSYYGHGEDAEVQDFDAILQEGLDEMESADYIVGLRAWTDDELRHSEAVRNARLKAGQALRTTGLTINAERRGLKLKAQVGEMDWGIVSRHELADKLKGAATGGAMVTTTGSTEELFWLGVADMVADHLSRKR